MKGEHICKVDKKKSILNVSVSMVCHLATVVMSILVRRVLIRHCGNDVNGLNALYVSIIGFLAVAELGVGSAITFCMYRPIVEGDDGKVSALYHLFRRLYLLIGSVVLVCGLALTPFIHYFAKDYGQLDVNLYTTFILMLMSVVITYLFGAELSLINAYKNNYITTAINSGGQLVQYVLQIAALYITGSFEVYLLCRIVAALVQWSVTRVVIRKKYAPVLQHRQKIDVQTRKELVRNIKAMFMHKIGTLLVNTVDSVVIAAFVGVVALGSYSNYSTIQTAMSGILGLVFSSLVSVLGHLYVSSSKDVVKKYCEAFHLLNFALGAVFYLGYYAVADDVIAMLFAEELIAEKVVSAVVALNGFVQFMRRSTILFRDATGSFYHDRWKPLVEGTVNVILSIVLVNRIGVTGVIVATILTNLLICHIVEPYVLYVHALQTSPGRHYMRNYGMMGLFVFGMSLVDVFAVKNTSHLITFCANGFIAVGIALVLLLGIVLLNRNSCQLLLGVVRRRRS